MLSKDKIGVRIQLKELPYGKSKCLTLYGADMQTEFNRLYFLYQALENSDKDGVRMVHYDKKTIDWSRKKV